MCPHCLQVVGILKMDVTWGISLGVNIIDWMPGHFSWQLISKCCDTPMTKKRKLFIEGEWR